MKHKVDVNQFVKELSRERIGNIKPGKIIALKKDRKPKYDKKEFEKEENED